VLSATAAGDSRLGERVRAVEVRTEATDKRVDGIQEDLSTIKTIAFTTMLAALGGLLGILVPMLSRK
jgi:hypothetical protein